MAAICSAICGFTTWKHESNEIVQWKFFTRRLQTGLRKDTMKTVINSCAQSVFIKHKGMTRSSIGRSLSVLQLWYSRLFIWLYFFYYKNALHETANYFRCQYAFPGSSIRQEGPQFCSTKFYFYINSNYRGRWIQCYIQIKKMDGKRVEFDGAV